MKISLAINEPSCSGVARRLIVAKNFFSARGTVHVDISDGRWTLVRAVACPAVLRRYGRGFVLAGHLMLPWRKMCLKKWYDGTFRILYLHVSEIGDWDVIRALARPRRVIVGAVVRAGDSAETFKTIPAWVKRFLVLAVPPGKSGQLFDARALATIDLLKKKYPHAIIAVDGGINKATAARCKKSGAGEVVSASYIWCDADPARAYRILRSI